MSWTPLEIPYRIYREERIRSWGSHNQSQDIKNNQSKHKRTVCFTQEASILNLEVFACYTLNENVSLCFSYMLPSLLKSACLISKGCGQTRYLNWVVDRYPGEQTPKGSSCWRRESLSFISKMAPVTRPNVRMMSGPGCIHELFILWHKDPCGHEPL